MIFGLGQVSEALNYSNSMVINNETIDIIAKEGGGANKSGGNKSGSKKSEGNKSGSKKSGGNKSGLKKSGGKKTKPSLNEVMREKAKERYKKWKENKKTKKSNVDPKLK